MPGLLGAAARAAYQLTAESTELAGALRLLAHWGASRSTTGSSPRYSPPDSPSPPPQLRAIQRHIDDRLASARLPTPAR